MHFGFCEVHFRAREVRSAAAGRAGDARDAFPGGRTAFFRKNPEGMTFGVIPAGVVWAPMNASQIAKLVSFVTTEKTLKHTTETSDIAGLPAVLTELSATIGEINAISVTQKALTEGKTARRNELIAEMREVALEVANAVGAHADAENLTEVLADVDVTPADFDRLRIPERPLLALRIHAAALAALPQHPAVPELKAKIEAVQVALSQPREAIAERRAATLRLADLFDTAERLLGRIDRMLYPLRKSSPQFYAKYRTTRKAYDLSRAPEEAETAVAPAAAAGPASTTTGTQPQALAA